MQHPVKKKIRRSRRWLPVCLVLLTLALAAAFVLLLPVIRDRFPAQTPPFESVQSTVRTLASRDSSQMESIVIYPDGQTGYTLRMQNGVLMLDRAGEMIAIDEDYQTDILNAVTQINVQDTVTENAAEVAEHLQAMGFDHPQCKAVVRYADGSEETFEVGSLVYGGTDYYFRWSGVDGIYTCHSGILETFTMTPNLLIPFEQPQVYGSLLKSLSLSNRNGECAFQFENGLSGQLTLPCTYPLTDDTAQTLITAAENFRLGAYEAPLTEENRTAYGFDQPLCIVAMVQAEGMGSAVSEDGTLTAAAIPAQTLEFVIGRAEGDFFYTCAYQDDVYLISRFLVETLVQADWQTLISRTPAAMGDNLLSYIVFETSETTVEIQITRTESVLANNELERDADGNIVYLTTVKVNGKEAPQEQLDVLLDRLNAFSVEGSIPDDAVIDSEPRWRITLITETGRTRVLEGFRLDVFSDAVAVDGVICHYVYDEAIDVLMTGLV